MLRSTHASRVRLGALSLAVSGILFVLYPLLRPFSDEASLPGAEAFASTAWIVAHLLAVVAFILLALGLLGLHIALQQTAVERLAFLALILSWIGVGLTLPYYGAEVFGLHALGQEALRQHSAALLAPADAVRYGPGFIVILVGFLLVLATWMIRSNVAATSSMNHTPDRFMHPGIFL